MSEKIATLDIKREEGMLYFVKANSEGYLEVYKAQMRRWKK